MDTPKKETPTPGQDANNSSNSLGNFFARGTRPFLLVILVFALYLAFTILRPFLSTIIFATILAALSQSVHTWLLRKLNGRKNVAALATVVLLSLVIILPLFLVGTAMVSQGLDFASTMRTWIDSGDVDKLLDRSIIDRALGWVDIHVSFLDLRSIDFQSGLLSLTQRISEQFLKQGYEVVGNFASLVVRFMIMIFVAFYLVRDGESIVKAIKHLSPLREDQEDRIFTKIRAVARSVLMGSLVTALLQGIAAGIGLVFVGVPAVFWGTMIAFSSLIPVVGTALIWVPITIYLLLIGHLQSALFFAIWCAVVVGSIDNFIRPYLMRGEGGLSPFYIFLAIIGGIQVFGLAGLLYGPLIIGFAMVMLLIYEEEFRAILLENEPAIPDGPEIVRAITSFEGDGEDASEEEHATGGSSEQRTGDGSAPQEDATEDDSAEK
ncbi:AI-2E family transporter [Oceanidesulfovibrio marinus]|uniref:AI-2E family transporter n=1 Tax=Oceanidesulfovibrio marinus TaxID=370038 RepID=A0ABX6ND52_9BACT|nr:AI-2E family transporter [Oceanidesulfovibrio marinus]QJT08520.1 AI-2E family transporter [Oceanidesulfovibrio marinus]